MNITDHGLHILPGDSAGGTWLATFDAVERLLVHQDDLSSGPLIPTPDIDAWKAIRADYWREIHPEWQESTDEHSNEHDASGERISNLERLRTAGSIFIWVGNNISDQLFILFVTNLLTSLGVDRDLVRIVQFKTPDGCKLPYVSMAALAPNNLREIPTPSQPDSDLLASYHAAWAAVTANSPIEILHFLETRKEACPYLRNTLERLLLRYPQERSGLPLFDEWLIRNVEKHGPSAARVLGWTLSDTFDVGEYGGDNRLYKRLLCMASNDLPEPLVNIQSPTRLYRDTQVTLTDFGKAVVGGTACSWPTNPIDDWIGGVRISADCPPQWMVTTAGKTPANWRSGIGAMTASPKRVWSLRNSFFSHKLRKENKRPFLCVLCVLCG